MREEAIHKQLIPGIPDEIVQDLVFTKLPWESFHTLSSVSPEWMRAFRSRQVYEARVRSRCTEAFVVINYRVIHSHGSMMDLVLYSVRDNTFWKLPPVPHLREEVSCFGEFVVWDGKLYFIGGLSWSCDVHVMDLATRGQWKSCVSMQQPRREFTCGAMNGKIYVFGGARGVENVGGSEVYDVKAETWSPITRTPSYQSDPEASLLTDKFIVRFIDLHDKVSFAMYSPATDEWAETRPEPSPLGIDEELLFSAQGKVHAINAEGVYVHDVITKSWKWLHDFSYAAVVPVKDEIRKHMINVMYKDDLLLVKVHWQNMSDRTAGCSLLQSRGLGGENKVIIWEETKINRLSSNQCWYANTVISSMLPVEL